MIFNVEKKDWYKTGVYCIVNLINSEIYIGSTTVNFYSRYHHHKSDYNKKKSGSRLLVLAFDKYGFKNFEFKILCLCDKRDCRKMEQSYLDKGTHYNCSGFSDKLTGIKHPSNSKTRTVIGSKHHSARKIIQYTLDGKKIKEWNCIKDAVKHLGVKTGSHISQACLGRLYSASGYKWGYKGEPLKKRDKKEGRKMKVSLRKGDFYMEFDSQVYASNFIKGQGFVSVNQARIHRAINFGEKVYGYTVKKIING